MRFIRGVLYGFQPQDERSPGPQGKPIECAGTLRVAFRGQEYRLRRMSQPGSRGRLEINGRIARDDDPALRSLLGETPEELFENIFAIGLNELQQLSTLSGEQVARHLYGLSLGPEGEQIFRAHAGLAEELQQLTGQSSGEGQLLALQRQLAVLDKELARHGPAADKHAQLQDRIREQEDEIDAQKSRQTEIQHELRGRRFLTRIIDPWRRERDLAKQLSKLPKDDVDLEILNRFDELEAELAETDERRQALIEQARQLQQQAEEIPTRPELEQQTCAVQGLFEKSRAMQALERALPAAGAADPRERPVQELLAKLGGKWDIRRLQQADFSPRIWQRLSTQAQSFRQAARQRLRLARRYKKLAAAFRQLRGEWKTNAGALHDQTIEEARQSLQRRLHDLEELRSLRIRRDHVRKSLEFMNRELSPRIVQRDLPPFFWLVLWFFVCAGLVLLGAGAYAALHGYTGIVAGEKTAWIVGACYALLGLSVMGTTWWMKEHFETIDFSTPETGVERKTLEHELLRIEQTLERIARREAAALPAAPGPEAVAAPLPTEDELIRQVRQQLLELDRLEPAQARLETLRLRLSQWREQLQDRQRRVAQARRDWTDAIRRLGLTETLKISEAFEQCQALADAQALLRERDARSEREEQQRQELAAWQRQVRDLAERIEGRGFVIGNLYEQLARWEEELRQLDERRRERARLRQTVREHRREAAQLVEKIERMRKQRIGLLKRLGVADRGEIAVKLAAIDERKTIEHQLKGIREEIFKLAAAEPELAIVEEDLIRYDAGDNQAAIDELRREQTASETALQTAFETLGTLKRQVREIEEDRTLTSLRFDREQAAHALREAVEQWCAIKVADRVLDQLRHRIEQDRQPRLLLAASDYLQRFTCGKYRKIWTRLGEKALLVDDDQGQSLRVEHLSSGTREQVFLSVRLALIRDFARQGTELPLVLDDVTVNFDQTRTEAAVQTLAEVAAQGQQIVLLTCHQHLAQLFEQRGVEPIWLPNRRGDVPLQRSA
jgi:uncharacterized protein YhaN